MKFILLIPTLLSMATAGIVPNLEGSTNLLQVRQQCRLGECCPAGCDAQNCAIACQSSQFRVGACRCGTDGCGPNVCACRCSNS
ncbi:hypothetical protein BKA63DRAFT_189846 [Paraphoma chrysanthemicola]|nr:hypothetical protein BKA63DRAFT_189846 [Paraphoma chrysanthemicola]